MMITLFTSIRSMLICACIKPFDYSKLKFQFCKSIKSLTSSITIEMIIYKISAGGRSQFVHINGIWNVLNVYDLFEVR